MQHQRMIKYFLEAGSKEELVQAMIDNNVKFGTGFDYDAPIKDGKNWVVWFTISTVDLAKKQMIQLSQPKAIERE